MMDNLNNFIPARMKNQTFKVGKIPLSKIIYALLWFIIPGLIFYFAFKNENNVILITTITTLIVGLFAQLFIWIPTRSGHSIFKLMWLWFVYKSSYNNFKNRSQTSIFDIYKLKTSESEITNNNTLKFSQLQANSDGSYSLKEEFNDNLNTEEIIQPQVKNVLALKQNGVINYVSMLKINGYDITHSSAQTQENLLNGLHKALKAINLNHSLIKIQQPVNLFANIETNQKIKKLINKRSFNTSQLEIKNDILDTDLQHLKRDVAKFDNQALESNWYIAFYSNRAEELELSTSVFANMLNSLKINTLDLTKAQIINVLVSLYAPYISFNDKNIIDVSKINSYQSLLNFNSINFKANSVEVNPNIEAYYPHLKDTKTYMKIAAIDKYPENDLPFAWLYTLSGGVQSVVMHNSIIDKRQAQKDINASFQNVELMHGMTKNKAKKKENEAIYNRFDKLANAIGSGNESLFDTSIYTINYSLDSEAQVNESYRQSAAALRSFGFVLRPLTFEQRGGFSDLFIKNDLHIKRYLFPLPAYVYASSYPFINTSINDISGTIFGKTDKNELFVYDLFKKDAQRTNFNQFVVGKSGAGKSTYLKKLWLHEYAKGTKIILIDPENENKNIVKQLRGTHIDIINTPLNPLEINIFKINNQNQYEFDLDAKVSWLVAWFSTIFGWNDNEYDNLKKTYLQNYLHEFYKEYNFHSYVNVESFKNKITFPTITDLYHFIAKLSSYENSHNLDVINKILDALKLYFIESENLTKKLWNNANSLEITNSDLINFDISKIANLSSNLKRAMYMFVLDLANKEIWKNRLWNDKEMQLHKNEANYVPKHILLIVDEAHLLIDAKNPQTLDFLAETIKRIRKYYGGVITATQNIGDFVADKTIIKHSSALINNTQSAVAFGLNANDVAAIDQLWAPIGGLTDSERQYLGSASKGDCLYIIGGFKRIMLKVDIANDIAFNTYASDVKIDQI